MPQGHAGKGGRTGRTGLSGGASRDPDDISDREVTVVRLRRSAAHNRAQEISDELSESFGHFRSAAALGATAAAERLAPRVGQAREAIAPRMAAARDAVSPHWDQARDAAARSWETTVASLAAAADQAHHADRKMRRKARRRAHGARAGLLARVEPPKRRRWPWLLGVLALGAAAGVAGGLVARRRTPQWEDYEGEHGSSTTMRDAWYSARDRAREKAGSAVETAKEKAGHAVEAVKDKTGATRDKSPGHPPAAGHQGEQLSAVTNPEAAAGKPAPGGTASDKPTGKANTRTRRTTAD